MRMARALVAATASVLALASCSGAGDREEATATASAGSAPGTLDRCVTPAPAGLEVTERVLDVAEGVELPAVAFGSGDVALVLLHQTNGDGLCGWAPFAVRAAERGLSALAFDMCGYGDSICPPDWSERSPDQVRAAVDLARQELGAQRVVLIGASLGGARSVYSMAAGVPADAWVNVSGPPAYDGLVVADEAGKVTAPGLVVYDPSDGDAEFAAARVTARRAGAEFVRGTGGHGYDILFDPDGTLTSIGRRVLAFAAGSGS